MHIQQYDYQELKQRHSLYVKGQEFPFFHIAFKYYFCVSFPVA